MNFNGEQSYVFEKELKTGFNELNNLRIYLAQIGSSDNFSKEFKLSVEKALLHEEQRLLNRYLDENKDCTVIR